MPKKGKAPKEDVADTQDDDPSVRRIPEKPPPLPMQPKVLPTTISPPVPLLPLWDETKVMNTYTKKKEDENENVEDDATTTDDLNEIDDSTTYMDPTLNITNILPNELQKMTHEWKRPLDILDLPFWQEQKKSTLPEFDLCVVDLYVPQTDEEKKEWADILAKHEASVKAAEEAGEELPVPPVEKEKELPREILRPLVTKGSYSARFASIFELINSVNCSYLASKQENAPPPPTAEEIAAAEAAAKLAAEEAAAAAAAAAASKKKGKKGGKTDEEEVVKEEVKEPSDPNHPIQDGHFLWEAIYPKGPDGKTPKYNPNGQYSIKLYVNGNWRRIDVDDRIPINMNTGEPILPCSSNVYELWPMLLSKALCIVTRQRWQEMDCVSWLSMLTGWQIGNQVRSLKFDCNIFSLSFLTFFFILILFD
jgi:hypothetical protein